MILVIDDDEVIGRSVVRVLKKNGFAVAFSKNAIEAIAKVEEEVPEMVFLEIMLTGPDGFTFLNEMASYIDTMDVPVVIVSERDFSGVDLGDYGVVGFLDKNKMKPSDVMNYARKYARAEV